MYYEPGVTPHGLPYDPFKACVIPRPIAMFSANQTTTGGRKDSVGNAEDTADVVFGCVLAIQIDDEVIDGNNKTLLAGLEGSPDKAKSASR